METPLFYSALFIHVISFIVAIGSVVTIDVFGALWTLKKLKLSRVFQVAAVSEKLIWSGWFGLVLSGLVLITLKGYIDNLTWIKLFFVAMVGVNGLFLNKIKKSIEKLGDVDSLPAKEQFRMGIASAVSQLGWWGAFIIGFVHRHIAHEINWPPQPWMYMVGILLVISIVVVVGEFVVRSKNTVVSQQNPQI